MSEVHILDILKLFGDLNISSIIVDPYLHILSAKYIHSQYSDPDYRASPPTGSGTVNTILKPIFSGNIV